MVGKAEDKPADRSPDCVVIGAGPAGLAAALEFLRHGHVPLVLEKDPIIGGIARTESYQGFKFDMGGHRFFTKSDAINGLEYFCNEGDELWRMDNAELIALAGRELEAIGLVPAGKVIEGRVYRIPAAYPIYDTRYAANLAKVRDFCDGLENLRTVGRNGLHRYNNMDHSMLIGVYAVRMLLFGEHHDLWAINTEQEYHEQIDDP